MRLALLILLCGLVCSRSAAALEINLSAGSVELPQRPKIRDFSLRCALSAQGETLVCQNGTLTATLPEVGKISARLDATARSTQQWQAHATLDRRDEPLERLQKLAQGYGLTIPGTAKGKASLQADLHAMPQGQIAKAHITLRGVDYSETSGRYAAEKWNADLELNWQSASQRWDLQAESRAGQIYIEPVFMDFAALPLQFRAVAMAVKDGWSVESFEAHQGSAGTIKGNAKLDARFQPRQWSAMLNASNLKPLMVTNVQPFLIGTQLEGAEATGAMTAQVEWADGHALRAELHPQQVSMRLPKMGVSLDAMSGDAYWSATERVPSSLRWQAGAAQKIAFGATQLHFVAQSHDFDLLNPARVPLLDGALDIQKLSLHGLGSDALQAGFSGALQPINLAALCKALGWPEFSGTLSGKLPGLSIRDNVWQMEGTLQAQAFDGQIELSQLRATDPFDVLPRITTDIRVRRLDLESLTQVFSFGRITGRLDGDVTGLRLLAWKPVAFDARLYTTPDDDKPHRISQRAIDTISSIGGGPTGVLSRGFLSLFEDFGYSRIGLGCVLRDGRCRMSGVESTSSDADEAYTIVQGRLLPRIDVVGFARNVSWNNLIAQLDAARKSSGPSTQAPEKTKTP